MKINWDEWEEITREEYRGIGDEEVMWIMFHKGSAYQEGHYFKRSSESTSKTKVKNSCKEVKR